MRHRNWGPVGALALVSALTACSGEDVAGGLAERAVEQAMEQGGADVDIDTDSGTVTAETDDGTTVIGGAGNMPEGFPEQLPLPDADHDVVSSYSESDDEGERLITVLTATGTVDEVVDSFERRLDDAGWSVDETSHMDMGDLVSTTLQASGHGLGVMLTVTQDEEDTVLVSYAIGPDEG